MTEDSFSHDIGSDENTKNFIVQLVIQSIKTDDSPLRVYNDESDLIPISNFSLAMFELMNKRSNKSKKCKITGYKLQFDNINPSSENYKVININDEDTVYVEPCSFVQYKIETKNLSYLKLKLRLRIDNDKHYNNGHSLNETNNNVCGDEEEFFATFLGTQFYHDYESPHKLVVGSVIDNDFNIIGEIKLEYTIIKPWTRYKEFSKKFDKYTIEKDASNRPIMVGHRGSGVSYSENNPSEYMENSINSFIAAYEYGADFVELDIQLTKDKNIVVFHDTDTAVIIPTAKKLGDKKNSMKKRKKAGSKRDYPFDHFCESSDKTGGIDIHCDGYVDDGYMQQQLSDDDYYRNDSDSCSTDGSVSSLNVSIRHLNIDQLRSHKFVNSKSDLANHFKQSSSRSATSNDTLLTPTKQPSKSQQQSQPIGGLFPTLSEVLKELPLNLGVNIEIKSPQESKNGIWENDFGQNYDRNQLIDLTLEVIFNEKQTLRKIIFSSFDPWICSMLRYKQDRYPVMLLVEAKIPSIIHSHDIRVSSVDGAILFAAGEKFDGVVCCIDPVIDRIDDALNVARKFHLNFFTYGDKNNLLENILTQANHNVDGIITDRLKDLLPQYIQYVKHHGST